ncbi:unnamed protein product, partial [Prunus brigantina]
VYQNVCSLSILSRPNFDYNNSHEKKTTSNPTNIEKEKEEKKKTLYAYSSAIAIFRSFDDQMTKGNHF